MKILKSNKNMILKNHKSMKEEDSKKIKTDLVDILTNEKKRWFLKGFAINIFASESIEFWEDVNVYKKIEDEEKRKKFALKIYQTFLADSGVAQINTNENLIKEVKDKVEKKNYSKDLFDSIELDLIQNTMIDIFMNFKKSKEYLEMKSDNYVLSYLCE